MSWRDKKPPEHPGAGAGKVATIERQPMSLIYLAYLDGHPYFAMETAGATAVQALDALHSGLAIPEGKKLTVKLAAEATVEDLDRIEKLMKLKIGIVNLDRLVTQARAAASNIVIPGTGAPPH